MNYKNTCKILYSIYFNYINIDCKMEVYNFCAFIDILGFKDKITKDFDKAKLFYQKFMDCIKLADNSLLEIKKQEDSDSKSQQSDVEFAIFSDSVIIYGQNFKDLLFRISNITSWLNSFGFFFRGGIGYGKHFANITPTNYLIVSEALVEAVTIESQISNFPRIVISTKAFDAILSNNEIEYHNIAHYFIQDKNNLWFINPFFLNPDITNIYILAKENIKKYENTKVEEKYIWLKDICEYFDNKYLIRSNPYSYYSKENFNNINLFFYPAMFSYYIVGEKYNYKIGLDTYRKSFSENVTNIFEQHTNLLK